MSDEDGVETFATPIPGLNLRSSTEEKVAEEGDHESQPIDQAGTIPSAELSLAENDVVKVKLCGVCSKNESKYKCARCYLP